MGEANVIKDVEGIHGQNIAGAIYALAEIAMEAECDAAVMEAGMVVDPRIRELPIRKLVPSIRLDPFDRGEQRRLSTLEQAKELKDDIDYVVVSSRYFDDPESLRLFFDSLK